MITNDEQGSAAHGVPPDPGYQGFAGVDRQGKTVHSIDDIRKATLWGNLMAGGAGVEYYFGYQFPENDLNAEDFRSRHQSWKYVRVALQFIVGNGIPFWEMRSADSLAGNPRNENGNFCFAKPGEVYVVYLPSGGEGEIDLRGASGNFEVWWFNPREEGPLVRGSVRTTTGGAAVPLGAPPRDPSQDWVVLLKRR